MGIGPLATAIAQRVAALVTIGETGEELERLVRTHGLQQVARASDLGDAVRRAASMAKPGAIVLLSPAFTSFDMFRDYEDRRASVQGRRARGARPMRQLATLDLPAPRRVRSLSGSALWRRGDKALMLAVATLSAFGLVMVFSASEVQGWLWFRNAAYYFERQLVWLVLGLIPALDRRSRRLPPAAADCGTAGRPDARAPRSRPAAALRGRGLWGAALAPGGSAWHAAG